MLSTSRQGEVYMSNFASSLPVESFSQSEDLLYWESFFFKRYIAQDITCSSFVSSKQQLELLSCFWFYTIQRRPRLLCEAAAKVKQEDHRHLLVQMAFEELNKNSHGQTDLEMLLFYLQELEMTEETLHQQKKQAGYLFSYLDKIFKEAKKDSSLLGALLGFEMPMIEAAVAIAQFLKHQHPFGLEADYFQQIEKRRERSLSLNLKSFLTFAGDKNETQHYIKAFDYGLLFWKMFWEQIKRSIH